MEKPKHVLVTPLPAQGHVAPLFRLSQYIADYGVKVTFVTTKFMHKKLMAARREPKERQGGIKFVSIPDVPGYEDREDIYMPINLLKTLMVAHIQRLLEMNRQGNDDERISCVISDISAGWTLEVAAKMGIKAIGFCTIGATAMVLLSHIPKLIEDGVINLDGTTLNDDNIISEHILPWKISEWRVQDQKSKTMWFELIICSLQYIIYAEKIFFNSFYELEPSACDMIPQMVPVGPLLGDYQPGHSSGSLYAEDLTCLNWLDKKLPKSVIYAAFGSTSSFSQDQLDEVTTSLLELGHPFLLVVSSNLIGESSDKVVEGLQKIVGNQGKIVTWAPQERVLAHPSIACFVTHCGWNSAMEGISFGVPLLCCPYFADQFMVRDFICDVCKIGVPLLSDKNGIITKQELKTKLLRLLSDKNIRENSERLKELAMKSISNGGPSRCNLEKLVVELKS